MRNQFLSSFKRVIPDICFIQTIEGKSPPFNKNAESKILSLDEHAHIFIDRECFDAETYIKAITLSNSERSKVYEKKTLIKVTRNFE